MMRRFPIVLIALVLLSVSGLAAQQEPTTGAPLQLIDTDPLPGEELGLESPITLFFNLPVDCATAEQAISLTPAVEGALACDEAAMSVTFTPAEPYDGGTLYTVIVEDSLRALDGTPVEERLELDFSTTGNLMVTQVLPDDGATDVDTNALITVIFNRPVVPLRIAEEQDDLPDPLTFDPAVSGEGEWLNTSIYVFRPDPSFAGGVEYTVTVNAGLEAVDGAVLADDFTWSFTTTPPQVLTVIPENLTGDVPLGKNIEVVFNQPMNRESVEAGFRLIPDTEDSQPVSGKFEWSDDSTGFRFDPDDLLALDTLYALDFDPDVIEGAAGGARLAGRTQFYFATVPYPAIVNTSPSDGERAVEPYGVFTIYFSGPMDVDTLEDKVTIDPEPLREPDSYWNQYNNSFVLNFSMEPSTEYEVTIAPGMEDLYGNVIEEPLVVRFTTDAYDPDVALQVPGPVGFYNAYNEPTQLFLTHRNVSRVNLWLYQVDLGRFARLLTGDNAYYPISDYNPAGDTLLRQWQIPSDTPLNQRRYELLSLAPGGGNPADTCEGAPPSRLHVGDLAVVISDPDPVRARAMPPDGEILTVLYRDYTMEITGGPACANGLLWWEVALRDGQMAWVAEGDADEYYLDVRVPVQSTPVDVAVEEGEALAPGVYYLRANAVEVPEDRGEARHFLVVSTANLTVKSTTDEMVIWATDVNTGQPIAGAPITVYNPNFSPAGSGVTDADGLVRIPVTPAEDAYAPRLAILQTDEHFGLTSTLWSSGIEPYNFGHNFAPFADPYRTYLYTDRPIYRPDQPVYYRGIIRARDDVTYTPAGLEQIPVRIFNENGDVVAEETLDVTPFGTFSGVFELAPDAQLGYYRIVAYSPDIADEPYYWGESQVSFRVAEYRLPEFQVSVTPDRDEVAQGDTIRVVVESSYFFGGAVSNAEVEYRAVSQPYYFEYQGSGRYSFIDFNYDAGPAEFYYFGGEELASGTVTTDAQGRAIIELPADLKDATQSQTFTIEATVTDESGQAVSGRTDVVVHKGQFYVGVGPAEYVGVAGQETTVNLITVNWASEPVSNQTLDVEIVERRWSSVQEQDENGRTTWTWEVEEIPVTTDTVTTGADGRATITFTPPNGGVFKITASGRDEAGNEIVASDTIWVAGEEYISWRQQNSNRIDLIADKSSYQVGETATILITSPFQGTTEALISVERGGVLHVEHVTMETNSFVYELPITAEFAPNVYVGVLLVKGVDENNPVAAFRMGLVQLGVDNSLKELNIDIQPNVEIAGPGDTVEYTVRVTDYSGEPVQAEVGVALTDLASLSIADPNQVPILRFFYGQQALAVLTSTPLTINTDQLTQTVLDTIKGGGGGFGEGGIFDIREEFVDTAYWNASLTTDADGEATFSVTLPDNLTTWRLDVRAVTSGEDGLTLVGQDTFDLLSTKPLLIRPVTPRFFVVGDEVTLAAIVNNNTETEQDVQVALEATGVTFAGETLQSFTIPAGARQRVEWPVTVEDVQAIDLTFYANGNNGEFTDASKPPLGQGDARLLPVYRYEVPETVATGGLLREAGSVTEAIALPRRFDVTDGELTVHLDHSLAATTLASLDYLRNYPYQCTEQTVSRFLPNIMTFRALTSLGVDDRELERNLTAAVQFAVQRLYASQHVDGGWGWFVQDSSNPLTTAYALIGLAEARNQGFTIADGVIENAQNFLTSSMITPGPNQPEWRLNRQAFVLYALARSGAPDVARTATLYEHRERLHVYARAFLALALHHIDPDDSRIDTLVSDLISSATLSATGAHWDNERDPYNWNTNTRTTAIALEALVTIDPENALIPNIVRYLMVMRQGDAWETTQETAWSVMALTDWMVASGELRPDYTYVADFNGETLAEGAASPETVTESQQLVIDVADMLLDQANELVISRDEGDGVLYYTAHLRAFLPVPEVEPLNRGLIVERRYNLLGDEDETPITEAHVGDVIQVRLTIIAPSSLHYVVIEDPIPAGTDAVDPELETSQQIGTQPGLDPSDPLSRGWGWWWFSNIEFHDEKVVLFSTFLPAGTYEYVYTIRAGLPGTYNVIPPTGYEFYFPEVYGRGAGSTFTILP